MSNKYQVSKLIDSKWFEQEIVPAKSRRAAVKSISPDAKFTDAFKAFKTIGNWKVRKIE